MHDIGQYPLSHLVESVYRHVASTPGGIVAASPALARLAARPSLHVVAADLPEIKTAKDKHLARKVLERRKDLRDIFRQYGILDDSFIQEVADIIEGSHTKRLYAELMDSEYDCDRLDYVLRDAALCGVRYGRIDLEYLIENLAKHEYPTKHSGVNLR